MNKIVDVNINEDTLKYKVIADISIVNANNMIVYVDECDNISQFYQDCPDKHDYVFDSENSTITVRQLVTDGEPEQITTIYMYEVLIKSEQINNFDKNLKYIKMYCSTENYVSDCIDGIYYDPITLYDAEVKMLHSYCNTCLDDRQMQKLMLVVFKRQLLEQAIATSHNKEAAQYYLDLVRLFGVSINKICNNNGCQKCSNGMCSL